MVSAEFPYFGEPLKNRCFFEPDEEISGLNILTRVEVLGKTFALREAESSLFMHRWHGPRASPFISPARNRFARR
jgi:hypothetical protein